ncbi:MAG: putative dehydrogenase, partial [Granulosicoccus sp.]
MTEQPCRVALAGAGMISLYHLKAWQNAGISIVAICD